MTPDCIAPVESHRLTVINGVELAPNVGADIGGGANVGGGADVGGGLHWGGGWQLRQPGG